jgi:hypothetical protein
MKDKHSTQEDYIEPTGFNGTLGKFEINDRGSGHIRISIMPHDPLKEQTICVLAGYGEGPEVKANAAIMSQAKEMVKALQGIINNFDNGFINGEKEELKKSIIGGHEYWNPIASMVNSEFIAAAREVLKKALNQ